MKFSLALPLAELTGRLRVLPSDASGQDQHGEKVCVLVVKDEVNGYLVPVGNFTMLSDSFVLSVSSRQSDRQTTSESSDAFQDTRDEVVKRVQSALPNAKERRHKK